MPSIIYPETRRDDSVVENLHGRKVPDPYRWMEDPDSPETAEWVNKQNEVTEAYLDKAKNSRPQIEKKIESLMDYDKFSSASKHGNYYYYSHHVGLADQAAIMQATSLDGEPRVFLDPNKMSKDGTVSLGTIAMSKNGRYAAYGIKRGGSDWEEICVIDTDTLEILPEILEWAKFTSIAWTHDTKGFYYARYPPPASLEGVDDKEKRGAETDQSLDQWIYYHAINTPQSEDRLVFSDSKYPKRMYSVKTSFDGRYLLFYVSDDCSPKNQLWYVDLQKNFGSESDGMVKLIDDSFDSQFSCLANDDDVFYISTNWRAPRNRIITVRLDQSPEEWTELVPEHEKNVLASIVPVNFDQMALVYMEDAHDSLAIHSLKTGEKLYDVELPDIGSVSVSSKRDNDFLMYMFTSFLYSGTVYYMDLNFPAGDGTRVFRQMSPKGFDSSKYTTKQEFFTSKDGVTKVPMFVIGPKEEAGAAPQKRPCLLYGYGGFMISLTPGYSARWASWLECIGGIVVIANLRGGDEYGAEWHKQGILEKKQNVFDDFQWAAKHLCNEMQVTEPKSLLIMGGSNGGLLVGACVNQAPELYAAAVAQVGVHDIFRFHKFTVGAAWASDFGDPDKAEHFEFQEKYSPLHNVFSPDEKGVAYPSVLLTTGDHDDRVVPLHTLKYGATLQYKAGKSGLQDGRPLLVRVDVKAGHGAGKPTSKVIEELSDTLLFAMLSLDAKCVL